MSLSDFAAAAYINSLLDGLETTSDVKELLRSLMPRKFRIEHGFIIRDSHATIKMLVKHEYWPLLDLWLLGYSKRPKCGLEPGEEEFVEINSDLIINNVMYVAAPDGLICPERAREAKLATYWKLPIDGELENQLIDANAIEPRTLLVKFFAGRPRLPATWQFSNTRKICCEFLDGSDIPNGIFNNASLIKYVYVYRFIVGGAM